LKKPFFPNFIENYIFLKHKDMEKDWKRVFLSGQLYKVEIAKELLENNGIDSVILNKKDSSYLAFGSIELYVNENAEEQAIELLKDLTS
jgi:hypothetical protein